MAKTFILIDLNNLIHRAKHATQHGDVSIKIGMSMHILFNSISKMWKKFKGTHVVFCLDGKSWRREVYESYKLSRRLQQATKSIKEREEDELFYEAYNDLIAFLTEKTNCSVLKSPGLEADDLIACWVKKHPDDMNIIISTDSDFCQLLADNVEIYNGVTNMRITVSGVYDDKDKLFEFTLKNDGKIKVGKANPNFVPAADWIEWAKFSKIIRGDAGDGIFTAYPKVRQTLLRNAFEDRKNKGYIWNNLMLQTWKDHEGNIHRVLDDYNRNMMLIDLVELPDEIVELAAAVIDTEITAKNIPNIGIWFMKFCGKHDLTRLAQYPDQFVQFLAARYE